MADHSKTEGHSKTERHRPSEFRTSSEFEPPLYICCLSIALFLVGRLSNRNLISVQLFTTLIRLRCQSVLRTIMKAENCKWINPVETGLGWDVCPLNIICNALQNVTTLREAFKSCKIIALGDL